MKDIRPKYYKIVIFTSISIGFYSCSDQTPFKKKEISVCNCYEAQKNMVRNKETMSINLEDQRNLYKKYGVDYDSCYNLFKIQNETDRKLLINEIGKCN